MVGFIRTSLALSYYLVVGIGILVVIALITNWKKWSWLNRLGAMAAIILVFHIWEEERVPGGLHVIYNLGSQWPDRYPMDPLSSTITNAAGLLTLCLVLFIWGFGNKSAIPVFLISVVEVIGHVLLTFRSISVFGPQGQTVWYSPGLITAVLGFLPLAVGYLIVLIRQTKPRARDWMLGLVAAIVLNVLFIYLPEHLLKSPNTPYIFNSKGFYEEYKVFSSHNE